MLLKTRKNFIRYNNFALTHTQYLQLYAVANCCFVLKKKMPKIFIWKRDTYFFCSISTFQLNRWFFIWKLSLWCNHKQQQQQKIMATGKWFHCFDLISIGSLWKWATYFYVRSLKFRWHFWCTIRTSICRMAYIMALEKCSFRWCYFGVLLSLSLFVSIFFVCIVFICALATKH